MEGSYFYPKRFALLTHEIMREVSTHVGLMESSLIGLKLKLKYNVYNKFIFKFICCHFNI